MLYITTTKLIGSIPDELEENSSVSIFYKAGESLKIDDVEKLLRVPADISFEESAGREDMLVAIGMKLATNERICYIDPSLPVPKRFEDNIVVLGKKAARKKTVRKVSAASPKTTEGSPTKSTESEPAAGVKPVSEKESQGDDDPSHLSDSVAVSTTEAPVASTDPVPADSSAAEESRAAASSGSIRKAVSPRKAETKSSKSVSNDQTGSVACEGCAYMSKRGKFYACSLKETGFRLVNFADCKDRVPSSEE
jgi:hypothetical protein